MSPSSGLATGSAKGPATVMSEAAPAALSPELLAALRAQLASNANGGNAELLHTLFGGGAAASGSASSKEATPATKKQEAEEGPAEDDDEDEEGLDEGEKAAEGADEAEGDGEGADKETPEEPGLRTLSTLPK